MSLFHTAWKRYAFFFWLAIPKGLPYLKNEDGKWIPLAKFDARSLEDLNKLTEMGLAKFSTAGGPIELDRTLDEKGFEAWFFEHLPLAGEYCQEKLLNEGMKNPDYPKYTKNPNHALLPEKFLCQYRGNRLIVLTGSTYMRPTGGQAAEVVKQSQKALYFSAFNIIIIFAN